ncbi:hypothetical protein QJ856_gp1001 [Tupanvirus deep ocean]|uniref:Uncharacterized protein n=2 Tax=Tupanvirus TaxID=2094720 RepID=A0AC62A7N5_9VIRU|nr:hypothetical protein QJ856_gp1001 [Tupanvirus deep ocean]QKU33756.1 hypothetical protein [Tupanvirus deep ocean]
MEDQDISPVAENVSPNITKTTKTSWVTQQFAPETLEKEVGYAKSYFNLSVWQYLIIIGIAVSGLAAFINTYDAITNINSNLKACSQRDELQKELNTQFIVLMVLSSFAIVFGAILAWFLRKSANRRLLLTWGIITTGIFGILYGLAVRFQNVSNNIKLFASWITFIGFLVMGWFLSMKSDQGKLKIQKPIDWD